MDGRREWWSARRRIAVAWLLSVVTALVAAGAASADGYGQPWPR